MKKIVFLLVAIIIGLTSCKEEKKGIANENAQEIEHISNTDFKTKIEGNKVQLIDVRTSGEYEEAHLENATLINYKDKNFLKNALAKLDKSKPVYVYCHSGHRSGNSAKLLQKEGFKVYDMKGGIAGWKESGFKTVLTDENTAENEEENNSETNKVKAKNTTTVEEVKENVSDKSNNIIKEIKETTTKVKEVVKNTTSETTTVIKDKTEKEVIKHVEKVVAENASQIKPLKPAIIRTNTPDFKSKIEGKNVQLVDVRTPKEYKNGHIPKAKNINIYDDDFVQQAAVLDKSEPVYVYCRSGVRSMKAANKLKNAGYKVYNLNDGIKGWKKEGNNIEN